MNDDTAIDAASSVPVTSEVDRTLVIGTDGQELRVAEQRIVVTDEHRTVLDLPIGELRRIQFDLERGRPATLVIVPERAIHEPQVIVVPQEQLMTVGSVLASIGRGLDDGSDSG